MELTEEQRRAVDAPAGPLRIVAGPGSGKTRVVTQRIARFVETGRFRPHEILAVTFTVKATHEMRQRLTAALGSSAGAISVRTLHSLALAIIRRAPQVAGAPPAWEIGLTQERASALLDDVLDAFEHDSTFPRALLDSATAEREIARLKHCEPDLVLGEDRGEPALRLLREWDRRLHGAGVLTFDDLGIMALRVLDKSQTTRSAVEARYRAVFVDEYQDINRTQLELIRRVSTHGNVTVVGDDDQCIYAWRGSDPSFLRTFSEERPRSLTVRLSTNFRCPGPVVTAASAVIERNRHRLRKDLRAHTTEGPKITVRRYATVDAEIEAAVGQVAEHLQAEVPPGEVGVLSRNNDLLQSFIVRMRSEGLPVQGENPLRTTGGSAILSLLRTVLDGPGDPHLQRAVNIGRRRIRKSAFRRLAGGESLRPEDVEGVLATWTEAQPTEANEPIRRFLTAVATARRAAILVPPSEVLSSLFDQLELPRVLSGPRADGLDGAIALVLEVASQHAGDDGLSMLVAELEELRRGDESFDEAVSALTVHRAKGLEFQHVILLGVQGDTFPNFRFAETDPKLMEEERRLFYVALTRTKSTLLVSNHALYAAGPVEGPRRDGFIMELPSETVAKS
jgi:DNA helicase-2/ATP-dependent DNA helicase PcrA